MRAGPLGFVAVFELSADHLCFAPEASFVVATAGFTPDDHPKLIHDLPRESL